MIKRSSYRDRHNYHHRSTMILTILYSYTYNVLIFKSKTNQFSIYYIQLIYLIITSRWISILGTHPNVCYE